MTMRGSKFSSDMDIGCSGNFLINHSGFLLSIFALLFPSCDTITDPLKKIELFKALASPAFIGEKSFTMSYMELNSPKKELI